MNELESFFYKFRVLKVASKLKIKAMTEFLSFVDERFAVLKNKFSEAKSLYKKRFQLRGEGSEGGREARDR